MTVLRSFFSLKFAAERLLLSKTGIFQRLCHVPLLRIVGQQLESFALSSFLDRKHHFLCKKRQRNQFRATHDRNSSFYMCSAAGIEFFGEAESRWLRKANLIRIIGRGSEIRNSAQSSRYKCYRNRDSSSVCWCSAAGIEFFGEAESRWLRKANLIGIIGCGSEIRNSAQSSRYKCYRNRDSS